MKVYDENIWSEPWTGGKEKKGPPLLGLINLAEWLGRIILKITHSK